MRKLWLVLIVTLVASAALFRPSATGPPNPADELKKNRQKWQALHISHYRFVLEVSCLCGFLYEPYTFEVNDGKLVYAIDGLRDPISSDDIQAPPDSVGWFFKLATLDDLFDYAGQVSSEADKVTIDYDPQYGFPRSIWVDWSDHQAGDEIGLHVLSFQVVPDDYIFIHRR